MRVLLAIFLWISIVGGLALYMQARPVTPQSVKGESSRTVDGYSLELATTCDLEPDPFALKTETASAPPTLLVRINGKDAVRLEGPLASGKPFRFEPIPYLMEGTNELFVTASPPISQWFRVHALRVIVHQGSRIVEERSFWTEGGARIVGAFFLDIKQAGQLQGREHGH